MKLERSNVNIQIASSLKPRASSSIVYWSVFILAVFAITEFFTGYKYFQAGNDTQGYLMNSLWLVVFVVAMFFLAYRIYSEEKAKNNIRASFAPFEMIYKWRSK